MPVGEVSCRGRGHARRDGGRRPEVNAADGGLASDLDVVPGALGEAGERRGPGDDGLRDVQPEVIAAFVQIVAVYDAGAVGPVEALNVSVIAPAWVAEDGGGTPRAGSNWLTTACGRRHADAGETR